MPHSYSRPVFRIERYRFVSILNITSGVRTPLVAERNIKNLITKQADFQRYLFFLLTRVHEYWFLLRFSYLFTKRPPFFIFFNFLIKFYRAYY